MSAVASLVSTEWLASQLDDDGLRLVDGSYHLPGLGRDAAAEHAACHIPGATFLDIDVVADPEPEGALHHMLPSPERFAEQVGALGIGNRHRVVAYDSRGLYSAARVWWMFTLFGQDRVSVLDGGLAKWLAEGRPVERGPVARTPEPYAPGVRRDLVRRWQEVRANLDSGAAQVIDARTPERFSGRETDPYPGVRSGGHIPGSRNLAWAALLDGDGTMPAPDEIARRFAAAGLEPTGPVITTCGSGVTACILALGLTLMGRGDWAVYDGSWAEWGTREGLPIAKD